MNINFAYFDSFHLTATLAIIAAAFALSAVCLRFRKGSGAFLCSDCKFNSAALCQKAGRPEVLDCTSYRPGAVIDTASEKQSEVSQEIQ